MSEYRKLFTSPGVTRLLAYGLVARLPDGMFTLAAILAITHGGGTYVTAGGAVGTGALAVGLGNPVWGRLADRLGAPRILVVSALGQAIATAGLGVAAQSGAAAGVVVVLAAAAGASMPPVSAVMRAVWSRAVTDEDLRSVAYTLEAIVADAVFIGGPLLVSALVAIAGPLSALIAIAIATVAGSLAIASHPLVRVAPQTGQEVRHWLGALRYGAVRRLLVVGFLAIGSITAVEVAITAFAGEHGDRTAAGVLIALLSVGGVGGGLYWGSRRQPGTVVQQLGLLLALMAGLYAALALAPGIVVLGVLLVAAGLALNPMMSSQFRAIDAVAARHLVTESFAWLSATGRAGAATAAAVAGALVQHRATDGFLLAAGMTALGAILAVGGRGRMRLVLPAAMS